MACTVSVAVKFKLNRGLQKASPLMRTGHVTNEVHPKAKGHGTETAHRNEIYQDHEPSQSGSAISDDGLDDSLGSPYRVRGLC
jgi:hypothetical protein